MKFNIAYLGPEHIFHLRRDFILVLKYGLESLGHVVQLSGAQLDSRCFNLVIGAYFLPANDMARIAQMGVEFAHVNTEVIARDMLNFRPEKTDFLGAYLPSLRAGRCIWEAVIDNMPEHQRYGNRAHFLRWGWHEKLEDIEHRAQKDVDFYFFGGISERRRRILTTLISRGHVAMADHSCPYFLRNDRIARAKLHLNIAQEDWYTHVNAFRICYLANNRCAVLSEAENDPAGYLELTRVVQGPEAFADAIDEFLEGDRWKRLGEAAYERLRATPMTRCLEELLEATFSEGLAAAAQ